MVIHWLCHPNGEAPISPSIPTKPKPAAIELKAELPSKAPKLPGNGSPKPEEFMQWLSQIVDHIEAVPKLRPILLEPAKGWREFNVLTLNLALMI